MATHPDDDAPPPWKRKNPRKAAGKKSRQLTAAQRREGRARARAAGRSYPNLVDNVAVARKGRTKKAAKKTARKSAKKTARSRKKAGSES